MIFRYASESDLDLLAEWNHQLIQDEGHENPLSVPKLRKRMGMLLTTGYKAVIFSDEENNDVAYALYHEMAKEIYMPQFFVDRTRRREGIGRRAMGVLFDTVWPKDKRLTVEALCHNTSGIEFWRAMGFRDRSLMLEIPPGR